MKRNKGFTLIELLVVIAIIGILSAIVLASLNGARNKANDARVMSEAGQLRSAAEIYYASNGVYYGADSGLTYGCNIGFAYDTSVSGGKKLYDDIVSLTGVGSGNVYCGINSSSYAIAFKLPSGTAGGGAGPYFCVDSSGTAKKEAAISNISLSGTTYSCN